jgi:hypothetical protein
MIGDPKRAIMARRLLALVDRFESGKSGTAQLAVKIARGRV